MMTQEMCLEVAKERLPSWVRFFAANIATPIALIGVRHDTKTTGNLIMATLEDVEVDGIVAILRRLADDLESENFKERKVEK